MKNELNEHKAKKICKDHMNGVVMASELKFLEAADYLRRECDYSGEDILMLADYPLGDTNG